MLLPDDGAEAMVVRYRECLGCLGHSSHDSGRKVVPALSGTHTSCEELVAAVDEVMHAAEVQCLRHSHPSLLEAYQSRVPTTLDMPLPPCAGINECPDTGP